MVPPSFEETAPMTLAAFLHQWVRGRLAAPGQSWLDAAAAEIGRGVAPERFGALLSGASRHARREPLAPTSEERKSAAALLEGLEIERWTRLETMRVALILSRPDLARQSAVDAMESAFQFADEGELCALYRSLALWPEPKRFAWRAGEGCRTNMRSVFEAVVCDTPFPAKWFDDVAFNQCVVKALFVGAPLWRVWGLDARLTPELARMSLDLADERRSAGRPIPPELWLTLGKHGGARGLAALELELDPKNGNAAGRCGASLALGRAGETAKIDARLAQEKDERVAAALRAAKAGPVAPAAFAKLAAD
jgi:hypothetical protein